MFVHIFLLILFVLLAIFKLKRNNIIEYLTNTVDVVLVGDSILNNGNYVGSTHTVFVNVKKHNDNTVLLAKDNAVISDVVGQLEQFPDKLNNDNTHVFLSIGGNDLLNHYSRNNVKDLSFVDSIFEKYKKLVVDIKHKYRFNLRLLNIYYPADESYLKFHKIIKRWNTKNLAFSKEMGLKTVDISNKLYKKIHFTKGIEPSVSGSKILAKAIVG